MTSRLTRWSAQLANWLDAPEVRALNARPAQTDAEFHREHYFGAEVDVDTCVGIRRVLRQQLRLGNTRPTDNLVSLFPDLDLGEVCFEIGEAFGFSFPESRIQQLDGSVDSLIRETQRLKDERKLRLQGESPIRS
ncbi:MAG: hypothetical protein U0939_19235 [Pirellulales bacterium]